MVQARFHLTKVGKKKILFKQSKRERKKKLTTLNDVMVLIP